MKKKIDNRINYQIKENEIRIVGSDAILSAGVYKLQDAINAAKRAGYDLIEISSKSRPVVCKIMEISKFAYEQNQKDKEMRQNQKESSVMKEIWVSQNIGENDLKVKANKTVEFLEKGNKVRITLKFHGREIKFKEQAELVMVQFAQVVSEHGVPESMPKLDGRKMSFTLKPLKK